MKEVYCSEVDVIPETVMVVGLGEVVGCWGMVCVRGYMCFVGTCV